MYKIKYIKIYLHSQVKEKPIGTVLSFKFLINQYLTLR